MIANYITIDGVTTQADLEDEKGKIDSDVASLQEMMKNSSK
ncbi:hypothetical protein MASR2M69_05930 [Bacteroidota bacterium]